MFKLATTFSCKNPLREFREKLTKNTEIMEENKYSEVDKKSNGFYTLLANRFFKSVRSLNPFKYLNQSNIWVVMYFGQLIAFLVMVFVYINLMSLYIEQGQSLADCSGLAVQIFENLKDNSKPQK